MSAATSSNGNGVKASLIAHLPRWGAGEAADIRRELGEIVDGVVEAAQHAGYPRRAQLDDATAQAGMTFEHAVEHEHRQEFFGRLVQ